MIEAASRLSEAIVLATVCAAPWMFGSVAAWSVWLLEIGIGAAALLAALAGRDGVRWRNLAGWPSLALGELALLAWLHAAPLPLGMLPIVSPATAAERAAARPAVAERVAGDDAPPVPLPAATLSRDPESSRALAVRLTTAWLLYQTVFALGGGTAALRRFAVPLVVNATVLGLFALVQALTWNGKIYWTFPSAAAGRWATGGPFVSHTHLAESLNLGLGLALGFLLGGDRSSGPLARSGRIWATYAVGALVLAVITSHSRGGFVGMLVGVSVTLLGMRSKRAAAWGGLAVVIILPLLFLSVLGDSVPYLARLETLFNSGERGYVERFEVWHRALGVWWAHPVWGTGFGTFGPAVDAAPGPETNIYYAHAENEYVELLVESGLIGFTFAAILLISGASRARRAWSTAAPADKMLVLGATGGVLAVLVNCVSDFGLHIPGVAVAVVVVYAHLCRLGAAEDDAGAALPVGWGRRLAGALLLGVPACGVIALGVREAGAEAYVLGRGLPAPNSELPGTALPIASADALRDDADALRHALRLRPDWAEGHLRLGLTELALYRVTAAEWLAGSVTNPAERAALSDPLWLLLLIHQGQADAPALLGHEPVKNHLVPAARSFLESRRCAPSDPAPHLKLATLWWLLEPNTPPASHLRRALRTAGPHAGLFLEAAEIALRSGELELATEGWRRALEVDPRVAPLIAEVAGALLPPEELLRRVVPEGRGQVALLLAERLAPTPANEAARNALFRAAADRLPSEWQLPRAERLRWEARAWEHLGERSKARTRMEAALGLEPRRLEWREELIGWLLAWDDASSAHNQALLAVQLSDDVDHARALLERTSEARARGESTTPNVTPPSNRAP